MFHRYTHLYLGQQNECKWYEGHLILLCCSNIFVFLKRTTLAVQKCWGQVAAKGRFLFVCQNYKDERIRRKCRGQLGRSRCHISNIGLDSGQTIGLRNAPFMVIFFILRDKAWSVDSKPKDLCAKFEIIGNGLNDKYNMLWWRGKEVFVNNNSLLTRRWRENLWRYREGGVKLHDILEIKNSGTFVLYLLK